MLQYVLGLLVIFVLFLVMSHYMNYTRITSEPLSILQSEHPAPDVIDNMLEKKQPIVFLYEMELWDGLDLIIGHDKASITEVLKDNTALITTMKTIYLKPFALSLTKDWNITLETATNTWDQLPQQINKQTEFGLLLANITGLMMACIVNPNTIKSTTPITQLSLPQLYNTKQNVRTLIETDNPETPTFDYITIPVRPSHMLYIPYGWYYWIYCGETNSYCTYLQIKNKTWFS